MQVQRQLAAALLMPHPSRQDSTLAGGLPILRAGRYAIEQVELSDTIDIDGRSARLVVQEILLRNMSNHAEDLHFALRRERLEQVWAQSSRLPVPIRALLEKHRTLVNGGGPIMKPAEGLVFNLQTQVTGLAETLGLMDRSLDSDVLDDLAKALSLAAEPPKPLIQIDQIDPDETFVRRRVLEDWKRWANSRGAASALFRRIVREAYNSTCIVCGVHLPQTSINAVPGVDAAHILPWADYDLDVVSNGLCLCKSHHWAFDEGLIVIREQDGNYSIEIPANVAAAIAAENPQFSIEQLTQVVGPIPAQRLPRTVRERPNPVYLRMLAEAE